MNNLDELNEILFDTVRSVKSGKMKASQAASICNVGGTIIDIAKVKINAAKVISNSHLKGSFFGQLETPSDAKAEIGEKIKLSMNHQSLYDKKLEFAMSLNYDSLASAIGGMGKNNFEQAFKNASK